MKIVSIMIACGLWGVITTACGLGWANEKGFNPIGVIVNLVGVIVVVAIINLLFEA